MNEAEIIAHYKELPRGRFYYEYEWEGNKSGLVRINWEFLCRHPFRSLPWKFMIVEENPGYYICIRHDVFSGRVKGLYYRFFNFLKRKFRVIYYRIILTLEVWGLAYSEDGGIPSWRDIGRKR